MLEVCTEFAKVNKINTTTEFGGFSAPMLKRSWQAAKNKAKAMNPVNAVIESIERT